MKKQLVLTLAAALALTACSANAITEKYRKQLQHEHKTQAEDAQGPNGKFAEPAFYTYADDFLEVVADESCKVKTVNGFAPTGVKHPSKDMDQVSTRMGVTVSVLKLPPNKCDITWMNEKTGKSGILKVK